MGPRAGLEWRKISSPAGFHRGNPDRSSVAIPTELPGPINLMSVYCIGTHLPYTVDTKFDCGQVHRKFRVYFFLINSQTVLFARIILLVSNDGIISD